MSMSKKDISNILVAKMNISHTQALIIVNDFFSIIRQTLAKGEAVKLSGFGNFILRKKSSRPGRNPKTGKQVTICARKVVTFKAGPKLKTLTKQGL